MNDEQTKIFLKAEQREHEWVPFEADSDTSYDEEIEIRLNKLEPLIVKLSSPDRVVEAKIVRK